MKDMGEANVILGIKIKRDNKGIEITQSHYIEKILKKFNREYCSSASKKQTFIIGSAIESEFIALAAVGVNTVRNAIGAHYLPHSSEYVAPPSINIVRPWFKTIRYGEAVPAKELSKRVFFLLGGGY
nr:zinc finger, CCHC-type [Tanacetum cinerariifolium]